MIKIVQKNSERHGEFEALYDDSPAGIMIYEWTDPETFAIIHTEVQEQFGGMGIGKDLVMAGIAYARKNNYKIIPICPFAKSIIDKNPELQDVLA